MLANYLLPAPGELNLESWSFEEHTLCFQIHATQQAAVCPDCSCFSVRVHSRYQRTLADLRVVSFRFQLKWVVRRFFCDQPPCKRVTFAEQLPAVAARYARKTQRLQIQQTHLAFEIGGEPGTRYAKHGSEPLSADTLLRLIRNAPEKEESAPRILGVDDWAFRKGQHYGTILVDLETRQPVDLLPERSAKGLATWLKEHPEVEVISRDRSGEYKKGATEGAPQATQVADRWHLLKNLREALERFLETKPACLRAAAEKKEPQTEEIIPQEPPTAQTKPLTKAEQQKIDRRVKRIARFETVKELHALGYSQGAIAKELRMCKRTIRKYIQAESCPHYPQGRRSASGKMTPYLSYLEKQWRAGQRNASQLWREIDAKGFTGSRGLVAQWAAKKREPAPSREQGSPTRQGIRPLAPSRAVWLLLKQADECSPEEDLALQRMTEADEKLGLAYTLAQEFFEIVRQRQAKALTHWLEKATKSGIGALKSFANGIVRDLAAVEAALSCEWSNGPVEGQVNRLKLIKRKMYGRANFDLLRKRVLGWSVPAGG